MRCEGCRSGERGVKSQYDVEGDREGVARKRIVADRLTLDRVRRSKTQKG